MVNVCDMYYVKAEHKESFLKERVKQAKLEWSSTNLWKQYPKFLRYRTCDYTNESFNEDDQVFCVYVISLKT